MGLEICIGVCQLKNGIFRHAFSTHAFKRHFSRCPICQALCWPVLKTKI